MTPVSGLGSQRGKQSVTETRDTRGEAGWWAGREGLSGRDDFSLGHVLFEVSIG